MSQNLVLALICIGMVACQNSSSGGGGAANPAANPGTTPTVEETQFSEAISACRDLKGTPTLTGSWYANDSSDGFSETSTLEFSAVKMSVTTSVEREGLHCAATGSSAYTDRAVSFYIHSNVRVANEGRSEDGKKTIQCEVYLNKGEIKYHFNGGCLVIVDNDQRSKEFAPIQKKAQPKPIEPNQPVPTPSLPAQPEPSAPQVPPTPIPQPDPTNPVVPAPSTPPAAPPQIVPGFSVVVEKACNSFSTSLERLKCFERLSRLTDIDLAVGKTCLSFSYAHEKMNCLERIGNITIHHEAVRTVCGGYTYPYEQMTCLQKFDNQNIDEKFLEICQSQTYPFEQVKCLLGHAKPN